MIIIIPTVERSNDQFQQTSAWARDIFIYNIHIVERC